VGKGGPEVSIDALRPVRRAHAAALGQSVH